MKSVLHPVTKWLTRLSEYLITYGAFGLFAVALLDSTFVPLPSSADALMLLLSTTNPSWMLLYAFMATSGSALGCWILYLISRRAGARALNRFSEAKQQRVKNLDRALRRIRRSGCNVVAAAVSVQVVCSVGGSVSDSVCCGSCWRSLLDALSGSCSRGILRCVTERRRK